MKLIFQLDLEVYPSMEMRLEHIYQFLTTTGLEQHIANFDTIAWADRKVSSIEMNVMDSLWNTIQKKESKVYELKSSISETAAKIQIFKDRFGIIIEWPITSDEALSNLLDSCIAIIKYVSHHFTTTYEIGGSSSVLVRDDTIRKAYPETSLDFFGENHLVDLVWSIKAPWDDEEAEESDLEFLKKVDLLPADITIYKESKLLIINWMGSEVVLNNIIKSIHRREKWYNENFDLPSEY
ncbi:MAG: hypothetical protein WEC15_04045 [Flavobacteriales bacterium]